MDKNVLHQAKVTKSDKIPTMEVNGDGLLQNKLRCGEGEAIERERERGMIKIGLLLCRHYNGPTSIIAFSMLS